MDWLTFIAEITKALAWPTCIVIAAILFRQPLFDLVPLLRKFKYKEFELEFSREVLNLKKEIAQSTPKEQVGLLEEKKENSHLLQLAAISPRAAIIESWLEVERSAVEALSSLYTSPPVDSLRHSHQLGRWLRDSKLIDENQYQFFQRLRELRNKAAHAEELVLSESDAKEYIELALTLASHLSKK
jgi:hypothetical protein